MSSSTKIQSSRHHDVLGATTSSINPPPLRYEMTCKSISGLKNSNDDCMGGISSDGYISYIIINGKQVKIIDNETKFVLSSYNSPSIITSSCFYTTSNNMEILCCFTRERELITIDLSSGRKLSQIVLEYQVDGCLSIELLPNHRISSNNRFIVVYNDKGIGLMDQEFKIQQFTELGSHISSIYYSKEKELIVVGFESGNVIFYKLLNNNLLQQVFTQQLCSQKITNIAINNIGKQHDFNLLLGTESNELILFYFVDYFKSFQIRQSLPLRDYLDNIKLMKFINVDKYSSLILLQDENNIVQLLLFNMNIWINFDKQLASSIINLNTENLNCNILNTYVHENLVKYQSNYLVKLQLEVLSNHSIFKIDFKNENLILSMVQSNPLEKLLSYYKNNESADLNNLFNELYNNNLLSVLVEYVQGTVMNDDNIILQFNNSIQVTTSQSVKQRFIIHDIKELTQWIKTTKEQEFSKLDLNLKNLLEQTNRTIPPLVLLESKNVLFSSIHKLGSLCLLIQAVINRANLIENVSEIYIPSLVQYKNGIVLKMEHVKTMIWFIENGLLPMNTNIYNLNQLQMDWNQRKLEPFPMKKINTNQDEFNSILNILNLQQLTGEMNPVYSSSSNSLFLIDKLLSKLGNTESYPPKDLKQFISDVFNNESLSVEYKHLIMFYLVIDNYSMGMNDKAIVSKLNNYAKQFNITVPYQHFIFGLWLLDTKRSEDSVLNQAVHYVSNLFINNIDDISMNDWTMDILFILIKSCSFNAAQRLLNILTSSTTSNTPDESTMDTSSFAPNIYKISPNVQVLIYLTNDMYHLAFDYQRGVQNNDARKLVFYCMLHYSLVGNCFIDLLSTFPFDQLESLWIEQFLKQEKNNELLLSYYILNSNYIDAYHLSLQMNNNSYLSIIGNIIPPIQKIKLDQDIQSNEIHSRKNQILKLGGRRIPQSEQTSYGTISTGGIKFVNQMTSFKSWLDQNDKASTFKIPSLFDVAAPKWIGKHKKHLLPNIEKQDLLYLPQSRMEIPEKMVEEEDDLTSSTSSESTKVEDIIPPRSQFGQKTIKRQIIAPTVATTADIDEEFSSTSSMGSQEEEEEEQPLMVNRLDYNKFQQVEQPFEDEKRDVFDSEEEDDIDESEEGDQEEEYVISD